MQTNIVGICNRSLNVHGTFRTRRAHFLSEFILFRLPDQFTWQAESLPIQLRRPSALTTGTLIEFISRDKVYARHCSRSWDSHGSAWCLVQPCSSEDKLTTPVLFVAESHIATNISDSGVPTCVRTILNPARGPEPNHKTYEIYICAGQF
jgi:hypothetical protein